MRLPLLVLATSRRGPADVNDFSVGDGLQALCEMLTIAGKKLDESSRVKDKVNGYFKTMDKLCNDKKLAPRIRFLVRDVLDLRRMKWVPRRETLKVLSHSKHSK